MAQGPGQVSFKAGDLITVLDKMEDGKSKPFGADRQGVCTAVLQGGGLSARRRWRDGPPHLTWRPSVGLMSRTKTQPKVPVAVKVCHSPS